MSAKSDPLDGGITACPPSALYSYGLNESAMNRGIQTLRGSRQIIAGGPVEVGHERQLLMDWHIVDDLNGTRRTVHKPQKHPDNPILRSEYSFEGTKIWQFGTVIHEPDMGLFKLWTPIVDDEICKREGTKSRASVRGHYYESDNGLTWRRPEIGLIEHEGSKANNIFVESYTDNLYVLRLPDRMRGCGRYAMVYADVLMGDNIENPEQDHGMRNLIS